jgi:hypothetical protein
MILVKELIEILSKLPQDLEVRTRYEGTGFCYIDKKDIYVVKKEQNDILGKDFVVID